MMKVIAVICGQVLFILATGALGTACCCIPSPPPCIPGQTTAECTIPPSPPPAAPGWTCTLDSVQGDEEWVFYSLWSICNALPPGANQTTCNGDLAKLA